MQHYSLRLSLLVVCLLAGSMGRAQMPNRTPSIADALKTVEVGADQRVTFRFYALSASSVTVSGDFLHG